jgi:hypothetical protein
MKRTITTILVILVAALSALAQEKKPAEAAKPAEAMPTVDQILNKYVQALGGKAVIEKLTSRVSKGTLDIPAMGANGPFELYEKAPNKTLVVITIPGFGVVQEGYNGTVAWSQEPTSGLREKTGTELADTRLDSEFYKPIKMKQLYPKLTLKGKEKVGDKDAYVIEATPAEGSPEKWYFDAQSGLLVRTDQERESPAGKLPIETYLEDYKDVDGTKVPMLVRQTNPAISFTIKLEEVKHNVPVDDAKFNKPAAQ